MLLALLVHHVDEKLVAFKESFHLDSDAIEACLRGDHLP